MDIQQQNAVPASVDETTTTEEQKREEEKKIAPAVEQEAPATNDAPTEEASSDATPAA